MVKCSTHELATNLGVSLLALIISGLSVPVAGLGLSKALISRRLKCDLQRHVLTSARPLTAPRTVDRYTTAAQANRFLPKSPEGDFTYQRSVGTPMFSSGDGRWDLAYGVLYRDRA